MKLRSLAFASFLVAAVPATTFAQEVYMSGLNAPRGLFIDADGGVYVAEAGSGGGPSGTAVTIGAGPATFGLTGGISYRKGTNAQVAVVSNIGSCATTATGEAVGAHDILRANDGRLAVLIGFGASPTTRATLGATGSMMGTLSYYNEGTGGWSTGVDFLTREESTNPDGGPIDSDPFGFMHDGTGFAVADAGANAAWVAGGSTVFSSRSAPNPFGPGTLDMQSVPTSIVARPGGGWLVGELTGFPFEPGAARIHEVGADGSLLASHEYGFTNIIDMAWDSHGDLLVLEHASTGILSGGSGSLKRLRVDGSIDTVISGLATPTSFAIGNDGFVYVTNDTYAPGVGQVLRYAYAPVPEPASMLALGAGLATLARRRRRKA